MPRLVPQLATAALIVLGLTACGGGSSVDFFPNGSSGSEGIPPFLELDWVTPEGESGTSTWAKQVAALPSDGDAIVAGGFMDEVTFDVDGSNETTLSGNGDIDAYIARYQPDGDLEWAEGIYADLWVDLGEIVTTSDDEITVVGYFDGELTLAPGAIQEETYDTGGVEDAFIARYDEDGILQWSVHISTSDSDWVELLAAAPLSDENGDLEDGVVVGGLFAGQITLGTGAGAVTLTSTGDMDGFLAWYEADGTFSHAVHLKGEGSGDSISVWSLDASENDMIAVVGDFAGSATVEGGSESDVSIDSDDDSRDGYLALYDLDGDLAWVRVFGGDEGDSVLGAAIAPDGSYVRVVGDFRDTATWEGGAASDISLTSEGEYDACVASYDEDGDIEWVRQIGGEENDHAYDVVVNDEGETLVIGFFTDEATFSGGGNSATIETDGNVDADGFIAGFGSDGTIAYLRTLGGSGDDYALSLEFVPGEDDVYTVGSFTGSAYLWHDASLTTASGDDDAFVARLSDL